MLTAAAGFLAYILLQARQRRTELGLVRELGLAAILWALGPSLYVLPQVLAGSSGNTSRAVLTFLGGLGFIITHPQALLLGIGIGIAMLLYQFPATFVLGLLGARGLAQQARAEAWMLGLATLGNVLFLLAAIDPRVTSAYWWHLPYYLQTYVVFAIWIGMGFSRLWSRLKNQKWAVAGIVLLTVGLPVLVYAVAPSVARLFDFDEIVSLRSLPGRDNLTYFLSPWKQHETGARQYGESILDALPQDGILFADFSIWSIIRYLKEVEGARPDVELVLLSSDQAATILQYRDRLHLFLANIDRYYDLEGIG